VVRGPDWKYGDQDGGDGYAGTVISTSELSVSGAKWVTVVWDSGLKAKYRSGPTGSHDLSVSLIYFFPFKYIEFKNIYIL